MYTIKRIPEEFQVTELATRTYQEAGKYGIYLLRKRNYSTMQAIQQLCSSLRKPWRDFGFAGSKDRRAVTEQYISIYNPPNLEKREWTDLSLEFQGWSDKKISLGSLDGNRFRITVRSLEKEETRRLLDYATDPHPLPNYFGPQRFSSRNHLIGKGLITKDFAAAADHIAEDEGEYGSKVRKYRQEHPTDHIGAIRLLPAELINLYIAAYQSWLYNKTVHAFLEDKPQSFYTQENNRSIPVVGFGTELAEIGDKDTGRILRELLRQESITPRDFILRQLPEATQDGRVRPLFFMPKDFVIEEQGEDEHSQGKKRATLSFTLNKSCYATTLLSCVLQDGKDILDDLV